MTDFFSKYTTAFHNMKRATLRGYTAPHKPILLLSVMQLIEDGIITSTEIKLDDELIKKFAWTWNLYVDDSNHKEKMMVADGLELDIVNNYPFKCNIANPFFHMQSECFWRLEKSDNYVARPEYSLQKLKASFLYAEIDPELFLLFKDKEVRDRMREELISMI